MSDNMPVGEWIEVCVIEAIDRWEKVKVLFFGKYLVVYVDGNGMEHNGKPTDKWRYPPDPVQAISDKIISEWCGVSIDNAYDNGHSLVVIDTFIRWLIEHGYVGVE